jgi:hypothetical protein
MAKFTNNCLHIGNTTNNFPISNIAIEIGAIDGHLFQQQLVVPLT